MSSIADLPGANDALDWILSRESGRAACPRGFPVSGRNGPLAVVLFVGCKQWHCPVCGRHLARRYAAIAQAGCALANERVRLLTLTCGREPVERAWGELQARWRKLHKRLARRAGGRLAYFLVVERQRRGHPHLHVLLRDSGYLPRPILRKAARECGFGYCDVRLVEPGEVVGRVATYMLKGVGQRLPNGTHRVRASRDWASARPKGIWGPDWRWEPWQGCDPEWVRQRLEREGLRVLRVER